MHIAGTSAATDWERRERVLGWLAWDLQFCDVSSESWPGVSPSSGAASPPPTVWISRSPGGLSTSVADAMAQPGVLLPWSLRVGVRREDKAIPHVFPTPRPLTWLDNADTFSICFAHRHQWVKCSLIRDQPSGKSFFLQTRRRHNKMARNIQIIRYVPRVPPSISPQIHHMGGITSFAISLDVLS